MAESDVLTPFENFKDKWTGPTGVLALLGGIIWGIQLNVAVVDQGKDLSALTAEYKNQQLIDTKQTEQLVRVGLLLENLEKRTTANQDELKRLEREAGALREKVIINTNNLRHNGNGR